MFVASLPPPDPGHRDWPLPRHRGHLLPSFHKFGEVSSLNHFQGMAPKGKYLAFPLLSNTLPQSQPKQTYHVNESKLRALETVFTLNCLKTGILHPTLSFSVRYPVGTDCIKEKEGSSQF